MNQDIFRAETAGGDRKKRVQHVDQSVQNAGIDLAGDRHRAPEPFLERPDPGSHVRDRRLFHWKATQMRFRPADTADKFNVDGEVLQGRPIAISVMAGLARLISVRSLRR